MKLLMPAEQARIKWSESRFLRQVFGTYSTQLIMAVLSMVSSVVIARALGPAGRGQYAVAIAIGLIGVQLGNFGLQSTNTYFVAKDRSLLPSLVGNALITSFVLGGLGAAALATIFQSWPNAPLHGRLLWLAAVWIPCGLAYLFFVNLFMGLMEVRLYNAMELFNRVFSAVLIIAVVWAGARAPETIFVAALAALVISLSLTLWKLSHFCAAPASPSFDLFRRNFQLGWKAYLSCLFAFLVIRIDLLMVRSMLGAAPAGYYSIAGTMADYVLLLPIGIATLLFPKLSGLHDDYKRRHITLKAMAGTGGGLLALLILLGTTIKIVVAILFGKAFAPAAVAFLLLAPGVLFLGLETVLVQYLNSRGFPISVVIMWVATTIFNIAVNLWAIPTYGINGAAGVSSISYLFALLGVSWIALFKGRPNVAERATAVATNY